MAALKLKPTWAILLVIISTVCYNLPSQLFGMNGYDVSSIPKEFYSFYCLFVSLQLLLITIYALYLFLVTENFKTKLVLLWLVIAEAATLVDHVLRKYVLFKTFSDYQNIITLIVFLICCSFVTQRAFKKLKSDEFDPERTYIINYLPKDFKGLINYLIRVSGHKAIYQDGVITGFSRDTGTIVQRRAEPSKMMRSYLKEIPRVTAINSIIGRRYSLMKYNCNHLEKYATRN